MRHRTLAERLRHQAKHFLGRARDQREHHDRECEAGRVAALLVAVDQQAEDEDAEDDRREAVHQVERELDRCRDAPGGELRQEERHQDAHRKRDCGRDRDEDGGADDQRSDAAPRLAEERQITRQEAPADFAQASLGDRKNDDRQHGHRRESGSVRHHLGQAIDEAAAPGAPIAAEQDGVEGFDRGHQMPPVRWNSKRRTTTCAIRFVASPITSRIAAR